MSALSDEIGYGAIIDQYFDAYNRKNQILKSPINEAGYLDTVKADLVGDIPLEQVYAYDNTTNALVGYTGAEIVELNQLLDTLKTSILEYLNANTGITLIHSKDRLQAIKPVGPSNFDVVAWP